MRPFLLSPLIVHTAHTRAAGAHTSVFFIEPALSGADCSLACVRMSKIGSGTSVRKGGE